MSAEIKATSVVYLPSGVRLKNDAVRNRVVLLAPERAVVVDAIAVAILSEIDGVKTVNDIVTSLAGQYQADPQLIATDVTAFLADLSSRCMLEIAP